MADNKTPSADQHNAGPEKREEIIHEITIQRPEDRPQKIVIDIPEDWQELTPNELIKFVKEHPEAAESLKYTLANAIAPAAHAALQIMQGGEAARELIETIKSVQNNISEVAKILAKTALALPKWADPDAIDAFYEEINALEPYLDAEIKKYPQYKGMKFDYFLDQLNFVDIFFFIEPAPDQEPPQVDPETFKFIQDLLAIRTAARIRAAKDAAIKTKAKESIDPLSLKNKNWLPLYQGALTNDLMRLSIRDFFVERNGVKAYYTAPNGQKYSIDQFDQLTGTLTTSTKKLLDTAVLYLSVQNFYGSGRNSVKPQVKIPLLDYLEKNGHNVRPRTMESEEEQAKENERVKDRIKKFKNAIRRDLNDLRLIKWTAEEKRGRNAGNYAELQIISGHRIVKDFIYVNFDIDAARYLVNAHTMFFPLCLLKHDNKKSNPYPIGRKIALHNSMDNNFFAGTDCTLSVTALLNAAPEIPTIEELQERGQRNWKDKIKKPLETALNENINVGLLKKWEYRHPKNGTTYTAEEARALPWETYSTLMIDFIMAVNPPGQEERRAKIKAEKEAAEAAGKITKKKRGRPRKQPKETL